MNWVKLKQPWFLRPFQEGLELIAPERRIVLELPDPEQNRDELASILLSLKPIEVQGGTGNLNDVLAYLAREDAISLFEKPAHSQAELHHGERRIWDLRKAVVGPHGPIHAVYWLDPAKAQLPPSFSSCIFMAMRSIAGESGKEEIDWAAGLDKNRDLAELKAIMEGIERHASGVVPREELIWASAQNLGPAAVDPRLVVAYKKSQYRSGLPLIPFTRQRKYYWKEVKDVLTGKACYLPVECLYYPLDSTLTPNPYTIASSSGVAAGFSFEDALLRALYETIERDAFMVVWCNRSVMPTITASSLSTDHRQRVRGIEEIGYRVSIVDITLDIAPVALVAAVSTERRPSLILGCAANLDFREAVSKALSEVERQLYQDIEQHLDSITDPTDVRGVSGHMALYTTQAHIPKAAFLWQGTAQTTTHEDTHLSPRGEIELLMERVSRQGRRLLAADLTPPFLKELGVWVVRAITLGLIPISFGYGMEPLGMPRLAEIPIPRNPWPRHIPFTHPFS